MLRLKVVIYFIFTIFCGSVYSQTIIFHEYQPEQNNNIEVPNSFATLVFNSDMELEFESSMEQLADPLKKNNLYILSVTEKKCVITVRNKFTGASGTLAFGQLNSKSFQPLHKDDVLYFSLSISNRLFCFDNTLKQKSEGANDYQMQYKKEALIILNLDPVDLNLEFSSDKKITEFRKDKNRYLLYVLPENQKITIVDPLSKASDTINLTTLKSKDVMYYYISLPSYLRRSLKNNLSGSGVNDYLGKWGGSLGNLKSFFEIQDIDVNTGKIKCKVFKDDVYYNFIGTLKLTDKNILHVTMSKTNNVLNNENVTIDISFNKSIGTGYWMSDAGDVLDINLLRCNNIPEDNTNKIIENLIHLKRLYEGDWISDSNNLFTSIFINQIEINDKVFGEVLLKNGLKYKFNGKLKYNNSSNSGLMSFVNKTGGVNGVILLTFTNGIARGTYTSDDGQELIPLVLRRNSIANAGDNIKITKKNNINNKVYTINDPDGFSNLRITPNGEIIRRVYTNESFVILKKEGSWSKVKLDDHTQGYIHNSRIKEVTK